MGLQAGDGNVAVGRARICLPRVQSMRVDWLARAALLPGRCLHYAVAVHMQANLRASPKLVQTRSMLLRFGVTRDAASDALTRLVAAGLMRADRKRGRAVWRQLDFPLASIKIAAPYAATAAFAEADFVRFAAVAR